MHTNQSLADSLRARINEKELYINKDDTLIELLNVDSLRRSENAIRQLWQVRQLREAKMNREDIPIEVIDEIEEEFNIDWLTYHSKKILQDCVTKKLKYVEIINDEIGYYTAIDPISFERSIVSGKMGRQFTASGVWDKMYGNVELNDIVDYSVILPA